MATLATLAPLNPKPTLGVSRHWQSPSGTKEPNSPAAFEKMPGTPSREAALSSEVQERVSALLSDMCRVCDYDLFNLFVFYTNRYQNS